MASLNKNLANGETGRGECEETKYTGQPTKPFSLATKWEMLEENNLTEN